MKKIVLLLALVAVGCATTSPIPEPKVSAPPAWNEAPAADAAAVGADWWHRFGSAELQALVDEALAGSPDMAIAVEHVRQAEAQVRVAGASLFPQIDASASTSARSSRTDGTTSRSESSAVSLGASYELDLWGRNAATVRGAEQGLRATAFDRETVRLTLVAGVANAYFEVLSLRGRLYTARQNLEIAERGLALVQARARSGAVSPLDVARQEAAVLSQRAALLPLEQQERQTLAALAEGRDAVLVEDAALIRMMGQPVLEALPSRRAPYEQVDPFILVHEGRIPIRHRYTPGVAGEAFFAALKDRGVFVASRCDACDITYCPGRLFCERCFDELNADAEAGPGGTLESFTVGHAGIEGEPLEEPVTVGLVRLDGADTVLMHFVVQAANPEIGMRVEAVLKPKSKRTGSILDVEGFRPV
jgi:uncharacterized OB-fold protein